MATIMYQGVAWVAGMKVWWVELSGWLVKQVTVFFSVQKPMQIPIGWGNMGVMKALVMGDLVWGTVGWGRGELQSLYVDKLCKYRWVSQDLIDTSAFESPWQCRLTHLPYQSKSNWEFSAILNRWQVFNLTPRAVSYEPPSSAIMPPTTHLSTMTSTSSVSTSHQRLLCKVRNTTNVTESLNPATHDLSVIATQTLGSLQPNPRPLRRTYMQAGISCLSSSGCLMTHTHHVQNCRPIWRICWTPPTQAFGCSWFSFLKHRQWL